MNLCHCGLEKDFDDCCGPLISGENKAQNPEQLMRSRYSAYVEKNIDYIMKTHHPKSSEDLDRDAIEEWSNEANWLGLEIVPREEEDKIEFIANFEMNGEKLRHHELSTFKKHEGSWLFYDGRVVGEPIERQGPKLGRNEPCHCGSGKKFKKCCL